MESRLQPAAFQIHGQIGASARNSREKILQLRHGVQPRFNHNIADTICL